MTDHPGAAFGADAWSIEVFDPEYWGQLAEAPAPAPASGGGIGGGYGPTWKTGDSEESADAARRRKRLAQERAWAAARGRDALIQEAKELVEGPGRRAREAAEARLAERKAELRRIGRDEADVEKLIEQEMAETRRLVLGAMLPLITKLAEQHGVDRQTIAVLMDLVESNPKILEALNER